ncbi:hypothetical protein E4631_04425 [Hymenobacter sp. UV11]|uniref:hypothetical protein n=1 Tax=Hymenobacter sp. UV11 TaxID=1849735 RepID=UPI00105DB435|nr:hypothetical protein [Hymenobacter sp. UV11]TDN35947.1 hypothetical protein A8B98_11060 [Hymenobacter sp. UV11]TFZ68240.1 hypothetical protein E4631_04425 [Hymenobacter sp. UV11]
MPTPSPLASLVAALAHVCHQAEQNHALLSKNEAATRAALIDPVLRALGWDTADVRMVEPERTVENKQSLDYVLKGPTGVIQSVVEAKKLGESLDKLGHVGALIGYAFSLKPVSFFITDGLNWHCYSPGHSHYEPTSIIELRTDNLLPAALQLLQLLDAAHGGHGLVIAPATPTISGAIMAPASSKPRPQPTAKSVTTVPARNYYPLSVDLAGPDSQLGKPQWLRLPDGTEHALKTWKDILLKAAELVLQSQDKLPLPLLDKAGKKTALLSWVQPKAGLSFNKLTYQSKPAYLYTNYSATACVANALYLLQHLPKSAAAADTAVAF